TLTDADDDTEIVSLKKTTPDGTRFNFLYKSNSIDFDYSLFTYAGEEFGGVRITIYRNPNESVQGFNIYVDGQFKGAKQIAYIPDEWYAVRVAITVINGEIGVSVAVDGIEIISIETDYDGEIGDGIKIKKSYGNLTFADFRTGDIKKPVINWQGKNVNKFTVGEDKPSDFVFTKVLSATDNYDKVNFSADDFTVEWQDGAIKDGKLVAGEWTITISVSDNAGNTAYFTITVLVVKPDEITVAFNVDSEVIYSASVKGALIEMPADPIKEGDKNVNYIFDGWYFGEKKWDFVNDYAFNDIELKAVFTTEYKEYTVVIASEGLADNYTYTLKLRFGSTLDENLLKRNGYSYTLLTDGTERENITVNGDMQVSVKYTPDKVDPAPKKSGCGGSVNGSFVGIVMTMTVLAFISVKKLSAKGGKDHD
ncbi:MAG: hypothetical protein J6Y43_02095, partial [Clostridia bacterium]|nr:hypothetical protein [Clostridia bacterium]